MRLEDLAQGQSIVGLEPTEIVSLIAVVPIAEGTVQVIYKTTAGALKDRLLTRSDEPALEPATQGRPWSFDGDGEAFKMAALPRKFPL